MPIELSVPITAIRKSEFYKIDERMLGHAFAVHNHFGRLLDESIYKRELADRCLQDGMQAEREVRVRVTHSEFVKDYFIDLLLCGSTIVEAKTAKETLAAHHGQGINYLLLAGIHHGSLINFRPTRLVRRFLSTRLTHAARRQFQTIETSWPQDVDHARLRDRLVRFCEDVGLGLDLPLYREAIATLVECPRQLVPIISGTETIGHQEMSMLRSDVGVAITGLDQLDDYRVHLRRFLVITRLSGIAWANLQLGVVRLEHLRR